MGFISISNRLTLIIVSTFGTRKLLSAENNSSALHSVQRIAIRYSNAQNVKTMFVNLRLYSSRVRSR